MPLLVAVGTGEVRYVPGRWSGASSWSLELVLEEWLLAASECKDEVLLAHGPYVFSRQCGFFFVTVRLGQQVGPILCWLRYLPEEVSYLLFDPSAQRGGLLLELVELPQGVLLELAGQHLGKDVYLPSKRQVLAAGFFEFFVEVVPCHDTFADL